MNTTGQLLRENVFLVGPRWGHHAQHSGYEAFGRYVGTPLGSPIDFRWIQGKWYPLNRAFSIVAQHPMYSVGAAFNELITLQHMVRHSKGLYHVIYGDTDIRLLQHARRLTRNRLIASFHLPDSLLRENPAIRKVAKNLDAVVLVCEAQRSYFEELMPPERVFVVLHGADTDYFTPPSQPTSDPICITVGAHRRDFETLRTAIRLVWESRPDMRFVAVGTQSDKNFRFTGLDDPRVTYLDRITDAELLHAYHGAALAVFSFEAATANNAVLEAMSSGLPIVATAVGGMPEYIPRDCGLLSPKGDAEALAASTLDLLGDSRKRCIMGKASRAHALTHDYRKVADRMQQIYLNVLKQR